MKFMVINKTSRGLGAANFVLFPGEQRTVEIDLELYPSALGELQLFAERGELWYESCMEPDTLDDLEPEVEEPEVEVEEPEVEVEEPEVEVEEPEVEVEEPEVEEPEPEVAKLDIEAQEIDEIELSGEEPKSEIKKETQELWDLIGDEEDEDEDDES